MAEDSCIAEDGDSVGVTCVLETFKEYEEVQELIRNLKSVFFDESMSEAAHQRFTVILNQYQEQPHLLDKHLDAFLLELLSIARDPLNDVKLKHLAFKCLYIITKVRGFKVVVRHLPHEVSDLEQVLCLLEEQDPQDFHTWETRYVLLLWLSIVVMIPFHMARLDDSRDDGEKKTVMKRLLDITKQYLCVSDKARDAAAFLSAHFVSRPDVMPLYIEEYLQWCLQILSSSNSCVMSGLSLQAGILSSLALLFKHGKREDIKGHAHFVLKNILCHEFNHSPSTLVRKMFLKLTQRIGLSFLKVKLAKWRYSRGTRCLVDNLAKGDMSQNQDEHLQGTNGCDSSSDLECSTEIPDEIEDVVEQMFVGLRDKDTILRWSAAKGIGRITDRLPKELADDVVTSVLELFTLRESDAAWHGGCLALAELGRRGLISPEHLTKVVGVVCKALVYDELRGNFSVGAHIRDAACYVCWSFARAYDPVILKAYIKQIAGALLINTVFDREVNCRRAASAAFQENVGRQGTLPHGIEILTVADYYAVGSRNNAFLQISTYIGEFPEYAGILTDHLVDYKVIHWDPAIRVLSAKALHNLTFRNHSYVVSSVLPKLLPWTVGLDLNARHGAILAVAEIIHAVALISDKGGDHLLHILGDATVDKVRSITFFLKSKRLFQGLGGILNLCAVNVLIKKVSMTSALFCGDSELIACWQDVLDISLRHSEPAVRNCAVECIPHFCSCYIPASSSSSIEKLVKCYLFELKADRVEIRCGYALAVGALPYFVLENCMPDIIKGLSECAHLDNKHAGWAEARRDTVRALAQVVITVGMHSTKSEFEKLDIASIYATFISAMDDYTIDNRGEIGAIVREAAMLAIQDVTLMICKYHSHRLQEISHFKIISCILQQCVEKIDRIRSVAGSVFSSLIHNEELKPFIVCADEIKVIFSEDVCRKANWAAPCDTFHLFVQLISLQKYTYPLLMGLIVSVGGLSESLVKYSRSALVGYLTSLCGKDNLWNHLADNLLSILKNNMKNDRILIPFFKALDYLFTSGISIESNCHDISFNRELTAMVWKASSRSSDPQKLLAAIDLLTSLLQYNGTHFVEIVSKLSIFLCHRFPRVRAVTASRMYETFVSCDILSSDVTDDVLSLLSDTDWNIPVENLRPIRNSICQKLNVPVPSCGARKA